MTIHFSNGYLSYNFSLIRYRAKYYILKVRDGSFETTVIYVIKYKFDSLFLPEIWHIIENK